MKGCPFCQRVADGNVWITMDPRVVTFIPLNPVTDGHRLFVPRRHIESAAEDPWLAGVVMQAAVQWMIQRAPVEDYNLITSVGPAATQTVFHMHLHYVPRRAEDGLHLPWTGQKRAEAVAPVAGNREDGEQHPRVT